MIDDDDREEWRDLLDRLEEPPTQELAARVADTYDVSRARADEVVFAAIDDGPLVEDNDAGGAYGVVRVAEERDYTPDEDEPTPLERYQYSGYAYGDEDDDEIRAIDASVWFTASNIGPAFAADIDDTGEWWQLGYSCACAAVEEEIVDALLADREADDSETDGGDGESANPSKTAESNPEEPEPEDENPGCGDDSPAVEEDAVVANQQSADDTTESLVSDEEAAAALNDAVSWFHQRIDDEIADHTEDGDHTDRPTTAREWFAENRRFDDATIDDKRLGWAPADGTDRLIEHLTTRGHSREAIKATGLFTDDLRLLWRGRYVFPYFDEDGRAAYAIARATGGLGGGAAGYDGHPEDFIAGKYAKLAHTKEYAAVEEPIFGLSTLDRDGPVIITEGVADAIRAHEYGYACLSPVTTQFKKEHREQLAEILKDSGRRTYIVQDAERPVVEHTDEVDGWDALGLEQYGEGVKGAARTAAFLAEEGIDAYLAELPRLGLDKVDLDDYLADWSDDLGSVLAGAKPGSQHPAYEAATLDDEDDGGEWNPDSYGDGRGDGVDLTEDEVADALDHVSTTLSYDDWIQLGYAVHAWNDGARGRRVFTEWSRQSPKWSDPESPNAIEWIWNNATAGGEVTVGTLIARAKEGGWEPPQPDEEDEEDEHTETPRDILGLGVVVEPAHALTAASAVEPDDLDTPLPELEREAVDDVAVAVAIAEGMIADASEFPTDGDYTEAYYRARDHYGAPLPKYLDNSTLEERADLCVAAVKRVKPKHILDAVDSEITVENPSGKATAKLNPTWEDSESGERILAGYGRGFYCVKHETSFSPIQLVALEHGYIDTEDAYPRGEAFKQSYRLLREEYGAPLPKWRATVLEHVAVLPPSVRVLQGSAIDKDLDDVYAETEALLRDALSVRDRAQLVTVVPNGGKTFSSAKIADEQPELYTAERNDLKQQMARYAEEIRENDDMAAEPTTKHLPILAEKQVDDAVLREATGEIRENGRWLLRDREELLDRVGGYLGEAFEGTEDDGADDDEEVDLDRESCPVASGEHGEAWALAVQTARSLGHEPSKIHQRDSALFGEPLPCQEGTAECAYTEAWDRIRQPENQADILIGSPGHAYVDSATTYFDTDENGDRVEKPRSVVVDEFLGDAYMNDYGERSVDHAVWIAEALVGVDNREDLLAAGLDSDTWVDCWLDGDGEEYNDADEILDLLEAGAAICEAAEDAERLLEDGLDATGATINVRDLRDALEALTGEDADLSSVDNTLTRIIDQLGEDADREYATGDPEIAGRLYDLLDTLESIHEGVTRAVGVSGGRPLEAQLRDAVEGFRAGGDLRELLLEAADAIAEGEPVGMIHAARTALRGGRDGCRELAVFADDGYAHPDAWALLAGVIATDTAEVDTATFAFDGADGGVFKRLERNGATIIADKNHHGAIVADPPAFTDISGGKCPVVGLDATARPELWRLALGRDTERRDIHDSPAERRRFLREVMNLRVIQTSNDPLPYHGDPEGKNFGEDIELVRTVAEKYTGDHADAVDEENPAVISTLKVINHLKESLEGDTSDLINYENMKGSDALGDRQVAVVLGSCHYGDAKPEKWGLLAGEDAGRGDSRGDRLDYGSEVANTYLAHMREDYTMQAILRAGRNDDESVVFAHTSALRDDLPVEDEAAVLSVHSKGTLAVAEAASESTGRAFTAPEIADELGDDSIGLRQVQNVLADLRENGYLRVENDGGRGNAFEYTVEDDPGLAEVDLPEGDLVENGENEIPRNEDYYTWNFVFNRDSSGDSGVIPPTTPEIPATTATDTPVDGVEPPS